METGLPGEIDIVFICKFCNRRFNASIQIVKGEFRQVFARQNIDDFCRTHAVIVVARVGSVLFISDEEL